MNDSGSEYKRIISSVCNATSGFCEFLGEQFKNSAFYSAIERAGIKTRSIDLRRKYVKKIENTPFAKAYTSLISNMLAASTRVYGTFFLTFGLYILLVFLVKKFAFSEMGEEFGDVILACGMILAGLPIFFVDRSISMLLRTSKITNYILTKLFAVRPAMLKPCEKKNVGYVAALILGLVFGSLTIFFSPLKIFMVIVVALMIMLVLASPESGIALLCLLLPFMDETPLLVAVCAILVSLLWKVFTLKRTFHFKTIDYAVLTFALFVFVFGLLSYRQPDGLKSALTLGVFILSYFAVTQLAVNNETFYCLIRSFLVGNLITSLMTLLQYVSNIEYVPYSEYIVIDFIPKYSIMMVLVVALPLLLGRIQYASSKLVAGITFLFTVAALILNEPDSYWMTALVVFFVAVFLVSKKGFLVVLFISFASVAVCNFFLPEAVKTIVGGAFASMLEPYKIMFASNSTTFTELFSGVGFGDASFKFSTSELDPSIVQKPIGSLAYILSSGGIVTVMSYLFVLVGTALNTVNSLSRSNNKKMKIITKMLSCSMFAMLIESLCRNFQTGGTETLMFWLVLGLIVAGNNCLDKEDTVDVYMA